jgi:hypothetical protein
MNISNTAGLANQNDKTTEGTARYSRTKRLNHREHRENKTITVLKTVLYNEIFSKKQENEY